MQVFVFLPKRYPNPTIEAVLLHATLVTASSIEEAFDVLVQQKSPKVFQSPNYPAPFLERQRQQIHSSFYVAKTFPVLS